MSGFVEPVPVDFAARDVPAELVFEVLVADSFISLAISLVREPVVEAHSSMASTGSEPTGTGDCVFFGSVRST